MKYLVGLVLILLVAAGGAWVCRRAHGAACHRHRKARKIRRYGDAAPVTITAPDAPTMKPIRVVFEQNGKQTTLFNLDEPGKGQIAQDGTDKVRITHEIGKRHDSRSSVRSREDPRHRRPAGDARHADGRVDGSRDVQVRLERPRVSVSRRTTTSISAAPSSSSIAPRPTTSNRACVVGDIEYPGFPAAGATVDGVKITDPAVRVAFFALLYDQDLNTPMRVFARDPAGNTARADFDHRTFPKPFKKSTIPLDDKFLDRVVPAILEARPRSSPTATTSRKFLVINGELRRRTPRRSPASRSRRRRRCCGAASCSIRSRTTPSNRRSPISAPTSTRARKSISRSTSASISPSFASMPIVAANRGKVLLRRRARHLRQLRHHRPRHGRAVALRRTSRRSRSRSGQGREGTDARHGAA